MTTAETADTLKERVAELETVLLPFAEMWRALELINADKPGFVIDPERAVFQTWGLKGTERARQITLGNLHAAGVAMALSSTTVR